LKPTTEALGSEGQQQIRLKTGILVIDDSTRVLFYAQKGTG
jgi:hypothetical protein